MSRKVLAYLAYDETNLIHYDEFVKIKKPKQDTKEAIVKLKLIDPLLQKQRTVLKLCTIEVVGGVITLNVRRLINGD